MVDRGCADRLIESGLCHTPDAFSALVRRHYDYLWRLAIRTSFNRDDAAEALQEALVSAYRKADTFRHACPVQGWLYRIVVNACLDRLRRIKPTSDIADYDPADGRDHHRSVEVRLDVREALDQLPEDMRTCLILSAMEGLKYDEIAQVMNVAPGTVKSRINRARMKLAQILASQAEPSAAARVQMFERRTTQ